MELQAQTFWEVNSLLVAMGAGGAGQAGAGMERWVPPVTPQTLKQGLGRKNPEQPEDK